LRVISLSQILPQNPCCYFSKFANRFKLSYSTTRATGSMARQQAHHRRSLAWYAHGSGHGAALDCTRIKGMRGGEGAT
jgi:hypothetical protein